MKMVCKVGLFGVVALFAVSSAFARWVSEEEVYEAAVATLAKPIFGETFPEATIRSIEDLDGLWCVHLEPKGHLVFSGSTLQVPVLSFSIEDFKAPQKGSVSFTIISRQRSRAKALELEGAENFLNEERWNALFKPTPSVRLFAMTRTGVELDVSSNWNQCMPWNDFCPQIAAEKDAEDYYENRAPVGCAVTMYSQFVNYYQWPARLDGVYAKTLTGNNCALNPSGGAEYEMRFNGALPIEWNTLNDNYGTEVFENERLAIARVGLLFDILSGTTFDLLETGGSDSTLLDISDNEWYDSGNANSRDEDGNGGFVPFTEEQIEEIKECIANESPIPAAIEDPDGGGHAVLIYGYKEENGLTYLKINYGWGNADNSNSFYEANDSYVDLWLIGHTPKVQLQVAPLPKVVNVGALPSVMWMVPPCYEDDGDGRSEFSSFTVVATPYSSDSDALTSYVPSTTSLEDPLADEEVYEVIYLQDSSGSQVSALSINEPINVMTRAYYHFPEAFIPTEETVFTCNIADLRTEDVLNNSAVTTVAVQLWCEEARAWETLEEFPNGSEPIMTIPLGDYAEQFCRMRLVVAYAEEEDDDDEEGDEEEETGGALCYAIYNPRISNVYAKIQDNIKTWKVKNSAVREQQLSGLMASEGEGVRYRIQVIPQTVEMSAMSAETFTRVTTSIVAFPVIMSMSNLADGGSLVENVLLEADLDGLAGIRVTCNDVVTELTAQTSCPTLIPDDAISVYHYDEHVFDVVINSPQKIAALDGSRMILYLEGKTAQGNTTCREVVVALRSEVEAIDYTAPVIVWNVDEEEVEIPHYWFRTYGLADGEDMTADEWRSLAQADADGDGLLNWQEYICATSPVNAEEKLQILGLEFDDDGSIKSIEYTPQEVRVGQIVIEGKVDLDDEEWESADFETHRFFRLRVTNEE